MNRYEVAVLGASGFAGQELQGILEDHPNVASVRTPDREELSEFEGAEIIFSALPHGESAKQVDRFSQLGSTVIDLSGDLRFPNAQEYERWYGQAHPAPRLLPVPYALPERHKDLAEENVISMPGCYPTATLLGLLPLAERSLIDKTTITVDADSGVSGRGKKPTELTHFMTMSGNAVSYNTGRQHRHVGEIEQFLDGREIFFSPTVIPIERGMLVKATARLAPSASSADIRAAFEEDYAAEPFVAVLPKEELPTIQETANTDECHIGFVAAKSIVQVGSSIDNLRKGAASQAVQAFNMRYALEVTTGLTPKAGWQSATV